ncbi:MAG: hypothetical protein ABIR01_10460, partial [Candidatus Eisenbacteria bacterium]
MESRRTLAASRWRETANASNLALGHFNGKMASRESTGRRVASLADRAPCPAGPVSWDWSTQEGALAQRASGTYFYRVRTGDRASATGM